jgi:hypothetical protein
MSEVLKKLEEQKGEAEKKQKDATAEKAKIDGELGHPPDPKKVDQLERAAELGEEIAFFEKAAKDVDAAIHAFKESRGSIIGDE